MAHAHVVNLTTGTRTQMLIRQTADEYYGAFRDDLADELGITADMDDDDLAALARHQRQLAREDGYLVIGIDDYLADVQEEVRVNRYCHDWWDSMSNDEQDRYVTRVW